MGESNPHRSYTLRESEIKAVEIQKDLGTHVSNNWSWEKHILEIVEEANALIFLIRRSFTNLDTLTFVKLCVCSALQSAFLIRSPFY